MFLNQQYLLRTAHGCSGKFNKQLRLFSDSNSHSPDPYVHGQMTWISDQMQKKYSSLFEKLYGTSSAEISFKMIYWLFKQVIQ